MTNPIIKSHTTLVGTTQTTPTLTFTFALWIERTKYREDVYFGSYNSYEEALKQAETLAESLKEPITIRLTCNLYTEKSLLDCDSYPLVTVHNKEQIEVHEETIKPSIYFNCLNINKE